MYILKPVVHETIWGGKRLHKYLNECRQKIGHLYLVSGHEEMSNEIINGQYSGKSLREVFDVCKTEWKMDMYEEFPLTIALVDAADHLSIQVHPDDMTAQRLEGKKIGKNESWLFLEAPDVGWIYGGCKCVVKEQIDQAISINKMEEITNRVKISQNDYVYIQSGTLHAMTAGSLVYEIEYGSDYTYRFYDFDRQDAFGKRRELHVKKAAEAIKPEIMPIVRRNIGSKWISEDKYEIRQVKGTREYRNTSNALECFSLLAGKGIVGNCEIIGGSSILLLPGESLNIAIEDAVVARLRN